MSASNFGELVYHVGHTIECVSYGGANVAVECVDCGTVLLDFDAPDLDEQAEATRENYDPPLDGREQ